MIEIEILEKIVHKLLESDQHTKGVSKMNATFLKVNPHFTLVLTSMND